MLQTEVWKNVNSPVNQKPPFHAASGWGAIFESAAFKLKPQPSKVCFESYSTQTQTLNFLKAYNVRNTKMDL